MAQAIPQASDLSMPVILVVEDDAAMRGLLCAFVAEIGYRACAACSGAQALALSARVGPDLVLLDIGLPDVDGLQVLRRLKARDAACKVLVISAYDTVNTVVEAMKLGAENYLTKPTPLPELRILIDQLLQRSSPAQAGQADRIQGVIGRSRAMQRVFEMIRRVASTRATVLIRGESGTGKEVIARAIHLLAFSENRPFVTVDCTSIPGNLMETELFGHERGAFTGARFRKRGLLEAADGGTLFLDEIGLMPLDLQAKLLNILETQKFRRVGGTRAVEVSVRFLAATNEDLETAVRTGRFREDLYYRLNVVPLDLPPLREREDDVLLLAEHFFDLYTSLHGTAPRRLAEDARAVLRSYSWPGNVRELRNLVERVVLLTDHTLLRATDLAVGRRGERGFSPSTPALRIGVEGEIVVSLPPEGLSLGKVEREVIRAALRKTRGNVTRAAALLKISRDALRYRMGKHGLSAEANRGQEPEVRSG